MVVLVSAEERPEGINVRIQSVESLDRVMAGLKQIRVFLRDEANDRAADGRLAAAGFADQAERLAAVQLEGDALHGLHLADAPQQHAAEHRKPDDQILDFEQNVAGHLFGGGTAGVPPCGYRWQRTKWPGASSMSGGSMSGHGSNAIGTARHELAADGQVDGCPAPIPGMTVRRCAPSCRRRAGSIRAAPACRGATGS